MKLYELPRNTPIKLKVGDDEVKLMFHHVDGMYSYCTNAANEVIHLAAWTEVEEDK